MRILHVNKYLTRRTGAEAYMFNCAELFAQKGDEVMLWGTRENFSAEKFSRSNPNLRVDDDLLVNEIHYNRSDGVIMDLKKFGHMIWSREAKDKFDRVCEKFKPNVIHLHNIFHQLSPSILSIAKRRTISTVMSVHDWSLINPNYALFDHGEICERNGLSVIFHRCIKNSFLGSFADVVTSGIHKRIGAYDPIQYFHAPTQFVKNKLAENGFNARRIIVVPYVVPPPIVKSVTSARDYVLFAGRLVVEKGIYILLEAARRLPHIQFMIAGTGPEQKQCATQSKKLKNVKMLGFVEKSKLNELLCGARLVAVPSIWYDPSPFAVLEAQALGVPVIASDIGGIADLIEDQKTGFLVKPNDPDALTDTIKWLWNHETLLERVSVASKEIIASRNNPESHYEQMMDLYKKARKSVAP